MGGCLHLSPTLQNPRSARAGSPTTVLGTQVSLTPTCKTLKQSFFKFWPNVVLESLGIGAKDKYTVRKTRAGIALKKFE